MKASVFIVFFLSGLACSVPAKSQTPDELKRISTMITQAKSKSEILKAWESVVRRNPKMDIRKTIDTILTAARKENEKNKSSQTYSAAVALIAELQKQMYDDARKILDNLKS